MYKFQITIFQGILPVSSNQPHPKFKPNPLALKQTDQKASESDYLPLGPLALSIQVDIDQRAYLST